MKRLIVLVTALCLATSATEVAGQKDHEAWLTLSTPDGSPMAGAAIAVYLWPDTQADRFVAELIRQGTTNTEGRFGFDVPADPGGADTVNVMVRAVDPAHEWRVAWHGVFESAAFNQTRNLVANISLEAVAGAQDRPDDHFVKMPAGPPEGEETGHDCDPRWYWCKVDTYLKWVKLVQHHATNGMRSTYLYKIAKETITGVGLKAQGEDWSISGSSRERKKRSAIATPVKRGKFHRVWRGRYRFNTYKTCYTDDDIDNGSCEWVTGPQHWTGQLKRSSWIPVQAERSRKLLNNHGFRLRYPFKRVRFKSKAFRAGVSLYGLSAMSQSGFSTTTALKWVPTDKCKNKWLYGGRRDVTKAPVVYAWRNCSG